MILQKPDVIILDEPTSALDAEAEARVQEVLETISSGKTVIVISHRTSLLRHVDRLYKLEDRTMTEVQKERV